METYIVNTNKGDVRLQASSYNDAMNRARSAGYSAYGARTAFSSELGSDFGGISYDISDGDIAFGIGGGLTIDSDGDLGMQIAPGISVDFDGGNDD